MRTSSSSAQGEYSSTSRYGPPTSYDSVRMEPSASMTDDLEPSDEWKERLKKKIADELEVMRADAHRQLEEAIRSVPHQQEILMREHQKALQNITVLAEDQFRTQLQHERQERKWAAAIRIEDSAIPDEVRAQQEALLAKFNREAGGDSSQSGRQEQLPGSAGISPPVRSNSTTQPPLPVLPERPPLPENMPPPPLPSPSKPELWVPKSSASSASTSRPPQSQRKDPPSGNRDWQDRSPHPTGGFPRPTNEHDGPALSKSPPPPSARLSPWSADGMGPPGGFGGRGTSPMPIDRPGTVSPLADHPAYQAHQPLPPNVASSPPGTSSSPQLWQPSISPEEETSSYASTLGFGPGGVGPGSTTSTSSSTSRPYSSIGRRGSSASMRSIASTNSTRSIASVTSMTSMRSSVSGKGRMGVDAIPENDDPGYDEDDDHAYGQRGGMEQRRNEEEMRNRIAESQMRMQQEQQRQKGVEKAWQRPVGGEGEVDDSRPMRAKTYSSIPILPVGSSSSSESKKSGKFKSKSKPLTASATAPPTMAMYESGYMHSGKEWDSSRDRGRDELGQSKTMRNALGSNTSKPPASATRPITIQPTLPAEDFESPYAHSQSPHPPLSSSASSSKRGKSISRKASSNFTEPPAIYGSDDIPPARGPRRRSKEQNSQMYDFEGPSFDYPSHRRNTSGPSVLPTPPSSTSNTRANSLRYPPSTRGPPTSESVYTEEPEDYEEGPAGVMDGYEAHRLSREMGEEQWGPENPKRRMSASASSAAKWQNSMRRPPGRPTPQPLSFDHGDDESANMSYRERNMSTYPNEGPHTAYPTHPSTWNPPRSQKRSTGGDSSPQKGPRPPHSADPYVYGSVSKRSQQSLREQEERQEPNRPQRATSIRSNGKSSAGPPPEWYSPRRPEEPGPAWRASQSAWGPPPAGLHQRRPPGDSDEDQDVEEQEGSSGDPEEGYRRRSGYGNPDLDESGGVQYPRGHPGLMGPNGRGFAGHGPPGPGGIRGRHQHRYRRPSERDQRRVRIEGDNGFEEPESEEQSQEEEETEEDSDEAEDDHAPGRRRNPGDESDFIPPFRSLPRGSAFPPPPGQYGGPAPSPMSRAPSGGPNYPRRGDGWDAIPPPQFREHGPQQRKKKKQKKRWEGEEDEEEAQRELVGQREAQTRAELERFEAERLERVRVETERARERAEEQRREQEREESEKREREERERREREERERREREERERREREEREKREREEREKREREENEKREREEREKREREREEREERERAEREEREKKEYMLRREREERELQEREQQWERERQAQRRREMEMERKLERERAKERREREERDRAQRVKEEEIERRLEDLKAYAAEAEEKMRHAQDLVEKHKLADERAEEYERKNEEATRLADKASKKWKEADKRYNEACQLVQMARQRAAAASEKELEIINKERELKEREGQLRRLEEDLRKKEEDRVFEERRRQVEEEKRKLEEEAGEPQPNLDQSREEEKARLVAILKEQEMELEELIRERDEKAKNMAEESYGLAEIFNLEDAIEEAAPIPIEEEEKAGARKPKGKKSKKSKVKKTREEAIEEEALEFERKLREEAEAKQRLEEEQRAADEQAERDREELERREREEREREVEKRAQEEREEKRKRRKEKRKSKELGLPRERRLRPTPEELEEQEQQALAAEERMKQEEQEARRLEQVRIEREQQEEQLKRQQERERIARQKEVEAMKRAREEMEAEERFRREQDTKRREEEERMEKKRLEEEERRKEEDSRGAQQANYRKMDEEMRRKRQDSGGGVDSAWSSFGASSSPFSSSSRSPPPARNFTTPFPGDRPQPAWASWGTTPAPTTPSSAWSTNMAGNTSTAGFPPRPSTTNPNKPRSGSMGSSIPDHQEWQRKQAEFSRQQEEKFRKEQERAQRAAWASREGGRIPTREDLVKLFEDNERAWAGLHSATALRWVSFPWPMVKRPSNPEDITTTAIEGYVLSQYYPDKSKSDKDRVKEYIKRWHPDRFETKLLPKVVEEEREAVKEGAGSVVRSLNDILSKMNDS